MIGSLRTTGPIRRPDAAPAGKADGFSRQGSSRARPHPPAERATRRLVHGAAGVERAIVDRAGTHVDVPLGDSTNPHRLSRSIFRNSPSGNANSTEAGENLL